MSREWSEGVLPDASRLTAGTWLADAILEAPSFPEALCAEVDPELFFPPVGGSPRAAQAICHRCVHERECAEWALSQPTLDGVWGGLTSSARRRRRGSSPSVAQREREERREQVARLSRKGWPVQRIAYRLGVGAETSVRDRAALRRQAS